LAVSAHLRAAFSAVSTASAPVFMGKAISWPVIWQIFSSHGASLSV